MRKINNGAKVYIYMSNWEKVLRKLNNYKQILKLRSDIKSAYKEVAKMQNSKAIKPTLKEFLDEIHCYTK
jgi:hypothetical protein